MEDHKVRAEYREKGRKRKEAELIDMEKHPSPMRGYAGKGGAYL